VAGVILEVKHLRLAEAVAIHGTLTNASKHLHLTQSALSHQLGELERRLGTPLFHRAGRRLVPTLAGEQLLDAARRSLSVLRRTERTIRRIASGQEAVLRLTTECYTAYHWLPAVLDQFAGRCPKVEVHIVPEASRHPLKALLTGKVDVAVMQDRPEDERLDVMPLFEDDMLVVMSPHHRLAAEPFVRPEELADEHLLMYTTSRADNLLFTRLLDPRGIVPRKVTAIQLTEAIVEMVKGGFGIAVLARWAVEPHLRDGSLLGLPLTQDGLRRQWSAVAIRQPATPLYVREFCRLLAAGPSAMARRGNASTTLRSFTTVPR
jgi:LysR family transcriptional regulator for metE and metH